MIERAEHDPDLVYRRLRGLCYRTTRLILLQKGLIGAGQSIAEANSLGPVLENTAPFGPYGSVQPANPHVPGAEPEAQAENHLLAAYEIGCSPQDAILDYLSAEFIMAWFPDPLEILAYETDLLKASGKALLEHGRKAAFYRLEKRLGEISTAERRDYLSLPFAYARDLASSSVEDDRVVMSSRLESIGKRARDALDLRTELAAMRALATVQGLTQIDADKSNRDLILLLGQGNHVAQAPKLEAIDAEVLPPKPRIRALPG